ncbi:MAG: MarR family winged helix-turn-helix transcriptional regulator [Candidatus Acidiferrales bacterium]
MSETTPTTLTLPCLGASFRRASRALTQRYDDALRRLDLRATQFTLLQVLSRAGEVSQGELGRMLAMDSTSLTRTLAILRRRRWVAKRRGADGRERRLSLTRSGKAQLRRALPHWKKQQERFRRQLGGKRWKDVLKWANQLATTITQ